MPHELKSRREVLSAIGALPSISELLSINDGHYAYEIDLEVVVYGRNYNGKKVGPYVRLLSYEPGEAIVSEGDWGGNSFFLLVDGTADVFVQAPGGDGPSRVASLGPGAQFGEMSVLAGVPRNATIKASPAAKARVIEVQRPALRLLRKLPRFSDSLDRTYRLHGRNSAVDRLSSLACVPAELIEDLRQVSTFRVFTKNHVLFRQGAPVDRAYILLAGWARRSQTQAGGIEAEDFVGPGVTLGTDGIMKNAVWPYTATLMDRSEILELSLSSLRKKLPLRTALAEAGAALAAPDFLAQYRDYSPEVREQTTIAQANLIETGLVDATNLLVMDMDLCVRCGNCSLACHKVHGQSRLVRQGIHLTRLKGPKSSLQSLLSPQVCMHCQDPECLTGCPTGAIGRFEGGQIDINSKTCIGCGDCATQCPYDAITMTARSAAKPSAPPSLVSRVGALLRPGRNPLPPAIEQTDDLVAIKCNLCKDTPLNPPGATRAAYSCEENCPTGALVRVDPTEYFGQVGAITGILKADQHGAIGRNIHRSDPPARLIHAAGIVLLAALGVVLWQAISAYGLGAPILGWLNMRWLTGLAGLAGIAIVMTYPVRKQMYVRRAGPLRYWMLVHSYVGAMAAVLIFVHSGRSSGGLLTTALMISFDATIVTGVAGIVLYLVAPRMLTRIEETPLLLDDLKARRAELNQELSRIQSGADATARPIIKNRVIGRFFSPGYILGQYVRRRKLEAELDRAARWAENQIGTHSDPGAVEQIRRAARLAATAGRVEALIYLHRLLKAWLAPHIISTSLMLALMVAHIAQVLYYGAR